jgi:hypothetical protein
MRRNNRSGHTAKPETQLSAFLANQPGVVARLCDALAEKGVNILAMAVLDTVDIGTMRIVVDDLEVAKASLDEVGAAYVEVPVITIPIPNTQGGFGHIARVLAAANINIEYVYATSIPGTEYSLGIFRVSDRDAALELDYEMEPEPATT